MSTIAIRQIKCVRETSWTYDNIKLTIWTPSRNTPSVLKLGTFNEGETKNIPVPFEGYRKNFTYEFPIYLRLIDVDDCSADDIVGDVAISEELAVQYNERPFVLPPFNNIGHYEMTVQVFFDTKTAAEIREAAEMANATSYVRKQLSQSKSSREYWAGRTHAEYVEKCTTIYRKLQTVIKKDPTFNLKLIRNVKTREIHLAGCIYKPVSKASTQQIDIHEAFDYVINQGNDFCGRCIGGLDYK